MPQDTAREDITFLALLQLGIPPTFDPECIWVNGDTDNPLRVRVITRQSDPFRAWVMTLPIASECVRGIVSTYGPLSIGARGGVIAIPRSESVA